MHQPIWEGLESYLAGKPDAQFLRHLDECSECRVEVTELEESAVLVRTLRVAEEAATEPRPGFYARVMDRIDQQKSSSIWSVFLEPLFARRLMYASAVLTVLLAVFLFTSPKDEDVIAQSEPERILTEEMPTPQLVNEEHDRNVVFVQFATYQGD